MHSAVNLRSRFRTIERLDWSRTPRLTRADKKALNLVAAWQHSTPDQLAQLMGLVTFQRANQVLPSLLQPGQTVTC